MDTENQKKQLKSLKEEKGKLSRRVGEAKKAGIDTSDLIAKVKVLSGQIRALESRKKHSNQQKQRDHSKKHRNFLPPQFLPFTPDDSQNHNITIQLENDADDWDSYVEKHSNATIYHGWSIKKIIEDTFGHNTHYLSARDTNGLLLGVLPLVELNSRLFGHFLVSVPFFNYGGALFSNSHVREKLIQYASNLAQEIGGSHIEFRDCHRLPDLPGKTEKVAMLLALPDTTEILWQELGTKLRAQIKKAESSGLQTRIGGLELVQDFYAVFSVNMRDLGTPVYTPRLFENMLGLNTSTKIIVLYYRDQPVSAGFLVGWRNTLEIPWASTLRSANALNANMKLYWEVLRYAIEQQYQVFDFGRSSKNSSTYRFKKQWGAKPYELHWHYWLPDSKPLPEINPNNPKYKLMIWGWKRLPVKIANILGPALVKHLP